MKKFRVEKSLRKKSVDATFPLTKEYKKLAHQAAKELTYSQIEKYAEKYAEEQSNSGSHTSNKYVIKMRKSPYA